MAFTVAATSKGGRTMRKRACLLNWETWDDGKGTARIHATLDQATDTEWEAGLGWYPVAHTHALEIGKGNVRKGAGILAALSPQAGWLDNLSMAQALVNDEPVGAPFLHWAEAIYDGADPELVLGGRKVRSFYRNIVEPEKDGPITVDRHAIGIVANAHGDWLAKRLERIGVYQYVASCYRTAARERGLIGSQAQAVAWLTYRRQRGIVDYDEEWGDF